MKPRLLILAIALVVASALFARNATDAKTSGFWGPMSEEISCRMIPSCGLRSRNLRALAEQKIVTSRWQNGNIRLRATAL